MLEFQGTGKFFFPKMQGYCTRTEVLKCMYKTAIEANVRDGDGHARQGWTRTSGMDTHVRDGHIRDDGAKKNQDDLEEK